MKKLLAALAFTLGTAAFAQADTQQNTQAQQEQKSNEGRKLSTGIEATEVLPGTSGAQANKGTQELTQDQQKALMNKAHAFNVNGTLKDAERDEVTLSRQNLNLPDVELDVRDQTQVMLDGKKVAVGDIPEGAQVRARFQMHGDNAVALELNATSPKGVKKGAKMDKGTTQPAPMPTENQ
ncbi:hypothetical protein [Archangium lipolyticum]|uniref:hypothetical protein n=1 Tax=Archangium lipolyticum TaxID=2970465 RepID=UPI00214A082E|nr:hypothetical protein [Archangium lipolyticum]